MYGNCDVISKSTDDGRIRWIEINFVQRQCRINNSTKCSNWNGSYAVSCNESFYYIWLVYNTFFSLRTQYFAKFAISSKRRFSIERCLCPEILVWSFLYSYVTKDIRLRSAPVNAIHSHCDVTMRTRESMQREKLETRLLCPHTSRFSSCWNFF